MNNQLIDVNNITSGMDLKNNSISPYNSSFQHTPSINQPNLPPNIPPNFSLQQPSSNPIIPPSFNEHQIMNENPNTQNIPLPDISQIPQTNNFLPEKKNFSLIKDLKWKDLDELSDFSDDSDYSDNSDYEKNNNTNYPTLFFNFIFLIILLIILFYVYKIYKEIMSYDED